MDRITLIDENNNKKEYKVLLIIDEKYKYIIYTNIENTNVENDIMVAKVKSLDNLSETLEITPEEWQMLEDRYKGIIKK